MISPREEDTHYVLRALAQKGIIKIQNFRKSPRKLTYCYLLTPTGIAQKALLAKRFVARKSTEYERLRQELDEVSKEIGHDLALAGASHPPALANARGGVAGHEFSLQENAGDAGVGRQL